jgi:hypothetical protein
MEHDARPAPGPGCTVRTWLPEAVLLGGDLGQIHGSSLNLNFRIQSRCGAVKGEGWPSRHTRVHESAQLLTVPVPRGETGALILETCPALSGKLRGLPCAGCAPVFRMRKQATGVRAEFEYA